MPDNPASLLPRSPDDVGRARALIDLGYPAVAPVLPALLEWLQDMSWPVARELAPFLASLGDAVLPEVRRVLAGDDDAWKYWLLWSVVREFPPPALADLRPILARIALTPTMGEAEQQVDVLAREILPRATLAPEE